MERFVNYAKTRLPSYLIPSRWARVESNVDDRNKLTDILLATSKIDENDQDEAPLSFEHRI